MTRPVQLQLAGPPLKNLKSSCSPRQKTALWRELYGSCPVILFFPVIFSLSTNQFLPTNYFSTPRGYVKTKKVLHNFATAPFRHSSTYLLCQSLVIERFRLFRIPRHKKWTIKVGRENLLLLIAQIITPLDSRPLSTDHLESIIVGDSRKRRLDLL